MLPSPNDAETMSRTPSPSTSTTCRDSTPFVPPAITSRRSKPTHSSWAEATDAPSNDSVVSRISSSGNRRGAQFGSRVIFKRPHTWPRRRAACRRTANGPGLADHSRTFRAARLPNGGRGPRTPLPGPTGGRAEKVCVPPKQRSVDRVAPRVAGRSPRPRRGAKPLLLAHRSLRCYHFCFAIKKNARPPRIPAPSAGGSRRGKPK